MDKAVDTSLEAFYRYLCSVKRPSTAGKYRDYAREFLRLMHDNGYSSFEQIPPGFLIDFQTALASKKPRPQPGTIRVQVYAVKKYLDWVESRGVKLTKQAKPELPKSPVRQLPTLAPERFFDYFRQADIDLQEPLRTAAMILPCCGLRAQELIQLKLGNIHRMTIKLKNGKEKPTLFFRFVGKGNKERNVPLMDEGVEILTGYLTGWRRRQPGQWLFPHLSADKKESGVLPVSDRGLRAALQKLSIGLGVPLNPHAMRRTYLTFLYKRGVDLAMIAKIAGHANVQTTLDHYIVMEPTAAITALHDAGSSMTEERRVDKEKQDGNRKSRHRGDTQRSRSQ